MKNRIFKAASLLLVLALCLLLTGCIVPPDDVNAGGVTGSGSNNYQDVAPKITPSPTPSPTPYREETKTVEPTLDWYSMWNTPSPTPTSPSGMIVTVTNGGAGAIGRVTPNVGNTDSGSSNATATPAPQSLKLGATGSEVRQLQTRLKELGYYKGSIDGDFGEGTEIAVKAFQQQNGLTVDGKAGSYTLDRLYSSSAKRAPSTPTKTPRPTATPTPRATAVPDTDVYLEVGSSGSKVRVLQNRLIETGWLAGTADGSYGEATAYAIKAFQKKHGLWEDGKAGPDTLSLLYSTRAAKSSTPVASVGDTLREGDSSDAVRAMQKRLKELGYLSGSADGAFGQATKAAVIAFQTANGLKADGKAGMTTLNLLYSDKAKGADSLSNSGSTNTGAGVTVNGYTTLREGDSGEAVKTLQRALKNRGYYSGSIDGKYGSSTVAAVTAFQQRNGLRVDGTAGPSTQTALYGSDALDAANAETLRPGDSGVEVRNLQYTLYELGYYDGKVDGVYGDTTQDAVRAFQIRNNVSPVDGIAGKKTLQVLYSSKAIAAQAAVTEYETLRKGDRGNAVVEMQDSLQQLGYLYEPTGYYDEATVEAVKNFQRRNGLTVDGAAGQETLRLLYSDKAVPAY